MIKLEKENKIDWIINNLDEHRSGKDWNGNFISHLLPDNFERYIKVLHTIYEDPSITNKETSWNQIEQEKIKDLVNDPVKTLLSQSTMAFSSLGSGFVGNRIKWLDLANRYNLPFRKTINVNSFLKHFPGNSFPRYIVGPAEGTLESHEIIELIKILTPYCDNMECYFYYDSLVFGDPDREDFYKGRLSEFIDLANNHELTFGDSPTYIWSEKKDWCINTDCDLSFTVIGCNNEVAEDLLSSVILETVEVDRETRIDYKADE
jgi:hypothetical protein